MRKRPNPATLLFALASAMLVACCSTFAATPLAAKHTVHHRKTTRSRSGISTFADSAAGDDAELDDPVVRQAAIRGLGRYNGSVVAIDPNSGRILSIVHQNLAFSDGSIPCSTIKPVIAVAALQEGYVTRDTKILVARLKYLTLVEAM